MFDGLSVGPSFCGQPGGPCLARCVELPASWDCLLALSVRDGRAPCQLCRTTSCSQGAHTAGKLWGTLLLRWSPVFLHLTSPRNPPPSLCWDIAVSSVGHHLASLGTIPRHRPKSLPECQLLEQVPCPLVYPLVHQTLVGRPMLCIPGWLPCPTSPPGPQLP